VTPTVTIIPFTPDPVTAPPFSANVTLDGATYSLVTMWNFYSSRWFFSLSDQFGNLVVNQPLIGSPPNAQILLAPGFFMSSTLVYRVATNNFEVTTA
jgi:hypothetical protein